MYYHQNQLISFINRIKNSGIKKQKSPPFRWAFYILTLSKKFQLHTWHLWRSWSITYKSHHLAKLLVCNSKYANLSLRGNHSLDSFQVDISILLTGTMTDINRELEHDESITQECLAKIGSHSHLFLCFYWQIKKNEKPHNAIFTKSFCVHNNHIEISGYEILRNSPLKHL